MFIAESGVVYVVLYYFLVIKIIIVVYKVIYQFFCAFLCSSMFFVWLSKIRVELRFFLWRFCEISLGNVFLLLCVLLCRVDAIFIPMDRRR